jgi:hypothetical protein
MQLRSSIVADAEEVLAPSQYFFRVRSCQFWAFFFSTTISKELKKAIKRAFLELFVDTGATKRSPKLAAFVTNWQPPIH